MKLRLPKFWILALPQFVLVLAAACAWFYFRTEALLAGPPSGDLYAHNWGFQLMNFVLVWLPAALLATGVLVALHYRALQPHYVAQESEELPRVP